jgi:molybdopterin/thiamine biosynthesis adenylyltransferase
MKESLKKLLTSNSSDLKSYKPIFFRLSSQSDKNNLENLLTENKGIKIFDELHGQLEELVKSRNPKIVYSKERLSKDAVNYLGQISSEEYGVWVYYPWASRLVHILDEEEFISVRTNRNQHKITNRERTILSEKKIGVVGLSIGQSVALTMTMERIYGEIRLADFDLLELSNMNRIRTGIFNLGTSKVIAVAREIAEIDPFLKVVCFTDGLTENNMDKFFQEGGKLDLLVEACDGLDMKILSRRKAKDLRIPVLMDTSDQGMLDVERFDLEPDRDILHGLIKHLDVSKLKGLTNEEKVPFLLPMIGAESISTRLKASMIEVEQTITTWPQLASSVALGGALGTDVARRIFLDEFHDSGRYYIDLEELIADKNKPAYIQKNLHLNNSLSDEQMRKLIAEAGFKNEPGQLDLDDETIKQLVTAGTMAPSGANSQSWKWMYRDKKLYLFLDGIYNAALLDCGNTTSLVGLGAACENLILKAHSINLEVLVESPPLDKDSILICSFKFFNKGVSKKTEAHICDNLVETIPHRLTNRNISKRESIDKSILENLKKLAATIPGSELKIVDNEKDLFELGEIIACMDRIRIMHEGGQQDFRAEIRWTKEEVEMAKNGIDLLGTVDLTPSELAGFRMVKEWPVVKLLNDWGGGTALEKIGRKSIAGSSAVCLVTMPEFSSYDFFMGGRALERVWLEANRQNICVHPASISTLIFNTILHGNENILPPKMKSEVLMLRKRFEHIFKLNSNIGEVLLIRLFKAGPPKSRSVRYPLDQILTLDRN